MCLDTYGDLTEDVKNELAKGRKTFYKIVWVQKDGLYTSWLDWRQPIKQGWLRSDR